MKSYLITCKGCEERMVDTEAHLREHSVPYQVFRGLNGKHSGVKTAIPYTADDPSGKYFVTPGHIALNINHWFLWGEALRSGEDVTLVMEDDIRVVHGFNAYLNARIRDVTEIDPGWQFIYVGHFEGWDNPEARLDCYEWKKGSVGKCKRDPFGTHCYVVRKTALPILIEKCERLYAGIDINIWTNAMPHLRHYACVPPLAKQQRTGIYSTSSLA